MSWFDRIFKRQAPQAPRPVPNIVLELDASSGTHSYRFRSFHEADRSLLGHAHGQPAFTPRVSAMTKLGTGEAIRTHEYAVSWSDGMNSFQMQFRCDDQLRFEQGLIDTSIENGTVYELAVNEQGDLYVPQGQGDVALVNKALAQLPQLIEHRPDTPSIAELSLRNAPVLSTLDDPLQDPARSSSRANLRDINAHKR